MDLRGPIPAHLLGSMWAESWAHLGTAVNPYPGNPTTNVTSAMQRQKWSGKTMFEKADEFFRSLGLPPMTREFWSKSVFERPRRARRGFQCAAASAWDFYNGKDYRIKQCSAVNHASFVTANHEMAHTQYSMAYEDLSYLYREGISRLTVKCFLTEIHSRKFVYET